MTNDRLIGRLQAMAKLDNLADEHYETIDQAIEALHRADLSPVEPEAEPVGTIDEVRAIINAGQSGIEASAEFQGTAVKAWVGIAIDWFRSVGGKSYVTMDMTDSRDGQQYTFTVQRAGGDSPATQIAALKAEVARLSENRT